MNEKWDYRFLELADHIATWSKDPSTQVGAVIVNHNRRVVSLGYNGFPNRVEDLYCRLHTVKKYLYVSHAERNALDSANASVEGCTLYTTLKPCNECAKSIIQTGIARVVYWETDREDRFNWNITETMFSESGVILHGLKRL